MRFLVTFHKDEDGVYIAECPSISGCVSQGATMEEADANIRAAINECLEVRRELGLPPTLTTREIEVVV